MAFTNYSQYQPVSDYVSDPLDEERKRRLQEAADEAANPTTPITQTVKTDPVTGEQNMTISGRPQDLTGGPVDPSTMGQPPTPGAPTQYAGPGVPPAPAPVAPIPPTGPDTGSYKTEADMRARVADQQSPDQAVQALQQNIAQSTEGLKNPNLSPSDRKLLTDDLADMQNRLSAARGVAARAASGQPPAGTPPTAPIAPVAPSAGAGRGNVNPPLANLTQPDSNGPVNPATAQAQQNQPQTTQGQWNLDNPESTFAALQSIQDPAEKSSAMTSFANAMAKAGKAMPDQIHAPVNDATDPKDLAKIVADPSAPPAQSAAASDKWADQTKTGIGMADAKKQFDATMQGPNPGNAFATLLASQKDEGSYLKAYLYHRLGLTDLAKTEQEKLGAGSAWEPSYGADGSIGLIKRNAQGMPLLGFNADGTAMDPNTLVAAAAGGGMKGAATGQTMGKAIIDGQSHTISHTILPMGRGVLWKDETTGQRLPGAPAGYTSIASVNPATKASIQVSAQVEARMRKANTDAKTAGATAPYTEDDIQNEKLKVLNGEQSPVALGLGGAPTAKTVTGDNGQPVSAAQGALPLSDSVAAKVARYEMKMPPGNAPGAMAIRRDVLKLNPSYDDTIYNTANKTREAFTIGAQGKAVQSANVAVDHLDTLRGLVGKLQTGEIPAWNDLSNYYKTATGQVGPTSFEAAKGIVTAEVEKAISGSAGALTDRQDLRDQLKASASPAQLNDVLDQYTKLMAGQLKGLRTTYESAGLRDFEKKLLPRTKQALSQVTDAPEANTKVTRSSW